MIEIQSLFKRFGSFTAVNGITFSVQQGEVLGFLGPNGAGKSTTMKMITGFLTPTSGTAVVCGHDVQRDPIAVKSCIGYLPEGAPAYPDMTPLSFLRFAAATRGFSRTDRAAAIARVADRVQLGGVLHQPIETLSKGFKRRVGLAQALLHEPQVLILDEPTDGLDPNQKHEVRALIREIAPRTAIVLSTHILEEVDAVCSRAIIIARGSIVGDGTPVQLRSRSRWCNVVRIHLRTPSSGSPGYAVPAIIEELKRIPQVAEVHTADTAGSDLSLVVWPRSGMSVIADIAALCRSRQWPVHELGVDTGRLDDVFRDLTSGMKSGTAHPKPSVASAGGAA